MSGSRHQNHDRRGALCQGRVADIGKGKLHFRSRAEFELGVDRDWLAVPEGPGNRVDNGFRPVVSDVDASTDFLRSGYGRSDPIRHRGNDGVVSTRSDLQNGDGHGIAFLHTNVKPRRIGAIYRGDVDLDAKFAEAVHPAFNTSQKLWGCEAVGKSSRDGLAMFCAGRLRPCIDKQGSGRRQSGGPIRDGEDVGCVQIDHGFMLASGHGENGKGQQYPAHFKSFLVNTPANAIGAAGRVSTETPTPTPDEKDAA